MKKTIWRALAERSRHWLGAGLMTLAATLTAMPAQAGVTNGNFETGDFTGWSVEYLTNNGITTFPPVTRADLGLVAGAADTNTTVRGTPAFNDGPLAIPLQGSWSANVNNRGNNRRASAITQTATMTLADVDPTDNKIHLRMAVAPVIQDGGHAPSAQAYFFVAITNVTKNRQMFSTFNFANQPGVPWNTVGGYQYTGWQAIDVAPGNGFLDVGDQVLIEVIAAGCNAGGHSGELYVDSVGPFFAGLLVSAKTVDTALPGTDVTYTYTYSNNSGLTVTDTKVDVVAPATLNASNAVVNATFKSLSAPGGTCTAPAVGSSDPVSCNFGTLNDHTSGTFQITYTVPATATTTSPNNKLNHGNYNISGTGASTFLGPLVQTNVIASGSLTDLAISVSDGVSSVAPNGALTYVVTVTNLGPTAVTGAPLSQTASSLTVGSWTCSGSNGGACGNATGSGALSGELVDLPVGASVTYTVNATAAASGTTSTVFSVAAPSGVTENASANNAAGDTNSIGVLRQLAVTKAGSGTGTVSSVPAGLNCGASCGMSVADGGQVILTASAPAGSIFTGWTGACTGTGNPCTISNMTSDQSVVATFALTATVTSSVGANGTATPTAPQVVGQGGTVVYSLTPSAGYYPAVSGTCPGNLVGNIYTVGPVTGDCTVRFDFSDITVTATSGANGSMSPTGVTGVVAGNRAVYTLAPAAGFIARIATGGTACGGTLSGNTFTTNTVNANCTVDVTFVAATANSIPTLSEWGLILMSALLGLMAFMHRRQLGVR